MFISASGLARGSDCVMSCGASPNEVGVVEGMAEARLGSLVHVAEEDVEAPESKEEQCKHF